MSELRTFRVRVYGELDEDTLQQSFDDEDSQLLGEPEGGWQVEFALRAVDEQAATAAAENIANGLQFEYGDWHGIDVEEFTA